MFSLEHHISIVFYPSPTRLILFLHDRDSIKDCQLPSLVHFVAVSRVVNNNRGFPQLLADCPEEMVAENDVEAEGTQESDNDTENDSQETESNSPETSPPFTLKVPVNIARTLMCPGH